MRSRFATIFLILVIAVTIACAAGDSGGLRDGDIVFQDFPSPQSAAIKLATNSEYSHCGVIFHEDGQPMVWEAVQPVRVTPLDEWIKRDSAEHYVVKRLRGTDSLLTEDALEEMKTVGRRYLGKNYDIYFAWSDDEFYCSEFVWKVYGIGLGLELVAPRTLGDYNLTHPVVQTTMKERWGDEFPSDEPVVAPSDLFGSELLETVYQQ